VSGVDIVRGAGDGHVSSEFPGVVVSVRASNEPKCARCWTHSRDVGQCASHPELCPRCLDVVTLS